MSNQIDTLFGRADREFRSRLIQATKRRKKRELAQQAIRQIGKLITLKDREVILLKELRGRMRDYVDALDDGMDTKLAQQILEGGPRGRSRT